MTFSLEFHAHSEVGRVRKNNQDAGYASPNMLLVADGMGGAAAGDLASAVAVVEASRADERLADEQLIPRLREIVETANERLGELVASDPMLDGMGTTFCGMLFSGTGIAVAHVGDSRGYRLRDGRLDQLTHDHSWVQSLIDEGRLTAEQAAVHPHRSLILKVLNGQPGMAPDYGFLEVQEGDRYLFCSDGLNGLVDDDHIRALLADGDLPVAARRLAAAANDGGGHDNITVVLGQVVPQDEALDAAPAMLVGSALEREIPPPSPPTAEPPAPPREPSPARPPVEDDEEVARYAPAEQPRRRWPAAIAWVMAIAVVLFGAGWAVTAYIDSRYFIADTDGSVAIYHGLPGSFLGRDLGSLVEVSEVQVADLPRFHQRLVEGTIGMQNLEEARATTSRLAHIAERCVAARQERLYPSPTPSPEPEPKPTGLSPGRPTYPPYLAPFTPDPSSDADPEDC